MSQRALRFVRFRYGHHSPHSGYARLAELSTAQCGGEIITVDKPVSRHIVRERMMWRLAKGTPGYDRAALAAELQVMQRMLWERECIYHFLYGETTYHYAGLLNRVRRNQVVATFHQPPVGIQQAVQIDWHLRKLSAVICVSRNQQTFFEQLLDRERIYFVPLGIDTEYFVPPATFAQRDPDLCLFVGDNYRDFPTLRGLIELVAYCRPQTRFVAVTSPRSFERIGSHPKLTLRSNLPEAEFRALYQSAALLVMPLHEATANNALLEGMACGLPVVVSDVGGISDYVTPACGALVAPGDARSMAAAVIELLDAPATRQQLGAQARAQASCFAWPKIIDQLQSIYNSL